MTDESDDILSRVDNGIGFVTLNRPKAINSLNQSMVCRLRAVLTNWEQDSSIGAVVLDVAPGQVGVRKILYPLPSLKPVSLSKL